MGAMPISGFVVAQGLVEAVDAVEPALQGRAQKFQARVVDDQSLHAVLSVVVVFEYSQLWLFDITAIRLAQDDKSAIDPGQCSAFH
ncbi:hypothetical protein D3C77_667300 [compost metagenome]